MTQFLLPHFAHLTVVDGSAELLARIPEAKNLEKIHSLFEDFAPTRRYNTVVVEHILEHVDDPVALLRLAGRCCAPGGNIVAGAPNAHSIHRLVAVKMGLLASPFELNQRDHALGHRRVYSRDLLREHVAAAGLAIVEVGGVFYKPLSNAQMQSQWTPAMLDGFYELGKDFPANAAEIFAVCRLPDR